MLGSAKHSIRLLGGLFSDATWKLKVAAQTIEYL